MIKRLLLIAVILGLGQIFIIISLKDISQFLSIKAFSLFGQTESNFQFLIILIAAGILSDAIRKIAQTTEWKQEYLKYQSAKLSFSLLILPLTLLFFVNKSFLIFLIAPIVGLSGEYAFYGTGKPVLGALVALIRIIIPYGVSIFVARVLPQYYLEAFILTLLFTYFLTGLVIAKLLNIQYFVKPSVKAFFLYFTSLNLGLVNILLYVQGLGMMLIIPLLFSENFQVISIAFIGLKFYAIFKSTIRIIHQALVREMIKLEECLIVDKLSMLLGFAFLAAVFIFPNSTITLLFGDKFIDAAAFFQMLAISCLVSSFCFSLATNALFMHFDKKLLTVCAVSAILCISSLILFSQLFTEIYAVGLALLAGEISLAIGLLFIYYQHKIFNQRVFFLIQNSVVLTVPLLMKISLFSDSLPGLFISIFCYSLILLFMNIKEFNSVKLTKLDY
jgi:O-antigen/teichoic acid export membrane protein